MDYLPDEVGFYSYLVVAACVISIFYLSDAFGKLGNQSTTRIINYGYDGPNGPNSWSNHFEEAKGQKQSPINLVTCSAMGALSELNVLRFSEEFHQPPSEMKIYNSGLNAVLYAKWNGPRRPYLTGGPLEEDTYNFLNLRFRWGPTDNEGSEHMVDTKKFAVEMQTAFMKNAENPRCELLEAARCGQLLMVSYFFQVTPVDNPYLEPIVQALKLVQVPSSCALICPFPLKLLTPVFSKNYFFYEGSLTFPPCTEGVKWIVQPEPLLISSRQVNKFRKLGGCHCGTLTTNSRPVQMQNGREVFYYD